MSVGDIRGSRRRFAARRKMGHAPKPKMRSVSESIQKERAKAERIAKAFKKKLKKS